MDTINNYKVDRNKGEEIIDQIREDVDEIFKIFKLIYSKSPIVLKDLTNESVDIDYKESIVNNFIDFKTIYNNFKDQKYSSITDAIKDIRLVLLNCYKFYGVKSDHTIKSLKIEEELEHQISLLDGDIKSFANIELTLKLLESYLDRKPNFKFRYPKNCYDSILLKSVAHCRPERLKEYHNILSTKLTTNADNARVLDGLKHWENEIYFNDNYQFISSMWELPEIGNFVAIIFKELDYDIVNQGEIERMFLMPKESTTMNKIMTTLLMPIKKTKYFGREMPYKIWSEKLCKKVSEWYKLFRLHKRNKVYALNSLGIHPDFWAILGDANPLVKCDYSELNYFIKVWIVKGLCDYVINKYKTINSIITNCNERQCTIWKNDMETEEYFFFKSMPDLRIYYYKILYNEPSLDFLEPEKMKEETEMDDDDVVSISSMTRVRKKSLIKSDANNFKLIADSVQGLRSFVDELDADDPSIPKSLIKALEKLVVKIEPQEYNLIMTNNSSKIKLFNDWKSYPERFQKEKDEVLFWEEKDVKTNSADISDEAVIWEKRLRKSVIKEKFDFESTYPSDEYISETDIKSPLSDLLDSEDDWEVMNLPKTKTKPSAAKHKLNELEKQFKTKNKEPLNNNKPNNCTIVGSDCSETTIQTSDKDYCEQIQETCENKCEKNPAVECSMNNSDKVISTVDNDEVISIIDNDEVILIEDDDDVYIDEHIVISDDDSIESIPVTPSSRVSQPTVQISGYYSLNNNLNQQMTTMNYSLRPTAPSVRKTAFPMRQKTAIPKRQPVFPMRHAASPIRQAAHSVRQATPRRIKSITTMPNLSPNISIMPANVHLPKGIEVSIVNGPQTKIPSHFNTSKRPTPMRSNNCTNNNPSIVNVECRVISKPNSNGEVRFYVKLPNGELHPVAHELINEYLRKHNNSLPDYWIVPLPVEVAKHFTNI